MASQDAAARDRSQERSHIAYARAAEPDAGIPAHVALEKQLHSGTGYNLVIDTEGKVYGTREPYNKEGNHHLLNVIDFEFPKKMTQGRRKGRGHKGCCFYYYYFFRLFVSVGKEKGVHNNTA